MGRHAPTRRQEVADSYSRGSFKAFDFGYDKGITTRVREFLTKGYSESVDYTGAPEGAKNALAFV